MKQVVVCDTREKLDKKKHIIKVLDRYGIEWIRTKVYVGDWTLLSDQSVCIDTKTCGMQEVYNNIVTEHARFQGECIRARDAGIRLIVLVEEPGIKTLDDVPGWKNPRIIKYRQEEEAGIEHVARPPVSSERLHKIMRTMSETYGVEWCFCDKRHTGETILQLLGVEHQ